MVPTYRQVAVMVDARRIKAPLPKVAASGRKGKSQHGWAWAKGTAAGALRALSARTSIAWGQVKALAGGGNKAPH